MPSLTELLAHNRRIYLNTVNPNAAKTMPPTTRIKSSLFEDADDFGGNDNNRRIAERMENERKAAAAVAAPADGPQPDETAQAPVIDADAQEEAVQTPVVDPAAVAGKGKGKGKAAAPAVWKPNA